MEKKVLSWTDIHSAIDALSSKLADIRPLYITGKSRGGLIPAVMLSHKTGVPYIDLSQAVQMHEDVRKRIVLVDDISDTGETFKMLQNYHFITTALHTRYSTSFHPDYTSIEVKDDRWIVYPWEDKNAKRVQNYLEFTD